MSNGKLKKEEINLEVIIERLDYDQLNIVQISNLLDGKYDLSSISQALVRIRNKKETISANQFGSCGIDPEVNPCGDARDY